MFNGTGHVGCVDSEAEEPTFSEDGNRPNLWAELWDQGKATLQQWEAVAVMALVGAGCCFSVLALPGCLCRVKGFA